MISASDPESCLISEFEARKAELERAQREEHPELEQALLEAAA